VKRSTFVFLATGLVLARAAMAAPADQEGVPASQAGKLPRTEERYRELKQQVEKAAPAVNSAKQKSETLAAQAASLHQQLIATAARVQSLEIEKAQIDADIVRLAQKEHGLAQAFAHDRLRVSHLLAVLERLQTDMPPAIALEPADALRSARGAMVLGAALPRVYGAAAALSKEINHLRAARAALLKRRADGIRTAAQLTGARAHLDQLLATKEAQASGAGAAYLSLKAKLDAVAAQASDLKSLLDRVAALRAGGSMTGMVTVTAQNRPIASQLRPGTLEEPVVGVLVPNQQGDVAGARAPGLSFVAAPGAAVVAPADSQVLFAGRYHKSGQVLILQTAGGYDLVLAGMDRIDVRPGDRLLAGEPVGRMPKTGYGAKLYFELRQNGRGVNPGPWLGLDLRKAKRS
jgi:septal ring factor EnvC (AmiA/AmiB activator)